MGLETGTMPGDLNEAWPLETDVKFEGPAHMRLTKLALKNQVALQKTFAQATITNQATNTVALTGTGSDVLIPPTGYVQVPRIISDIALGGFTVSAAGIKIPADGYYRIDGWLSCKSTTAASTLGVVFSVTRAYSTSYTPRPTPSKVIGANDLVLISGGGFLAAQKDDIVSVYIASSHTATITVPNANIRLQWMAPL